MKLVDGNFLWTEKQNIPHKYTYLSENLECDVAIIGGGITGALCAYYFVKAGAKVVVIDKNLIGYESTSASTSILQYEIDNDLIGLSGIVGMEKAVDCFKLCEKAVYDIEKIVDDIGEECEFSFKPCLYYTYKNEDIEKIKKEYKLRKEAGFNVEYIDEYKAKTMFDFPVKAGIYSKTGAGQINPYKLTHNILNFCKDNGAKIFENTEVVNLSSVDDGAIIDTKNKFKIKCKKAVIAEGFESRKYVKHKTALFTRTFTIVTKPIKEFKGWHEKCIIRDTEDTYTYLRTTDDNRIIIGGEDVKIKGEKSDIANLNNEYTLVKQKYEILEERLKQMFPNIRPIEIEYKFNGIFGETKDGLPYLGEYKEYPNCYFCMGYGSNGILYDVIGGQLLVDLYQNKENKFYDIFKVER